MDNRQRVWDLAAVGLLTMAIALVTSTAIASGSWKSVRGKPAQRKLRVTGSARKRIISDLIEWSASVQSHGADRVTASKELRKASEQTVAFLKKQGIKPEEIEPQSAAVKEVFETQYLGVPPNRIEKQVSKGFEASQAIVVKSVDMKRIEKASREVTSLLEEGVVIASAEPAYYYTRLSELKVEMLAAAAHDARARAENIVKSTGGAQIGKLLGADMGIINVNPANSTETSEEGNNDTSSLEKDIITIVHAEFELE
jgi:hypothetical protein